MYIIIIIFIITYGHKRVHLRKIVTSENWESNYLEIFFH